MKQNIKRIWLALCMAVCLFALSACSSAETDTAEEMDPSLVMTLQQGQQVTYLGQLGLEWAFVETTTAQGQRIRGFVELSNLNVTLPTDTTGDGING